MSKKIVRRTLLVISLFGVLSGVMVLYFKMAYAIPSLGITKACGEIFPVKSVALKTQNPYLEIFKNLSETDSRFKPFYDYEVECNSAPKYEPLIEERTDVLRIPDYRPETLVFLMRAGSGEGETEKAYSMAEEDVRKKFSFFGEVKNRKYFGWPLKTYQEDLLYLNWRMMIPFTYTEPLLEPSNLFRSPIGTNINDPKTWRN